MKSMVMTKICNVLEEKEPLIKKDMPLPIINDTEILIEIHTCGVCHTELDELEGRTPPPELPMILGHQIVGKIVNIGNNVKKFKVGDRVGIGWINSSCGKCFYCKSGFENLCPEFKATGRDVHGGYAEFTKINENFAVKIPDGFTAEEAAPLLCAGAIGYRSLKLSNIKNGMKLGLTGFGASAHLVLKLVKFLYPETDIFVFARNPNEREFAIELGAIWSGNTSDTSPELLDAIIDTTPVWTPVVEGLKNLAPGGRFIINAIRKENHDKKVLEQISYERDLWLEKEIKSVANVTTKDITEFLEIASKANIKPTYQLYELEECNTALKELKMKKIKGAKVLKIR